MDTTEESQTGWHMLNGHGMSLNTLYWWHSLLKAQAHPHLPMRIRCQFFLFWSNLLKDHISRQQSNKGTNGYLQKYYIFLRAKYCWNYFSWNMCVTAPSLSASLITNLESQGQSQAFCQPWGTHILSSFLSQRAWECPAPDMNRNVMSTARYSQSVNTQIKWWLWM